MAYQPNYHQLDIPLNPPIEPYPYSSLHLLYPGMPMLLSDVFDRYDIPHACPEKSYEAFAENKNNTRIAACQTEILALESAAKCEEICAPKTCDQTKNMSLRNKKANLKRERFSAMGDVEPQTSSTTMLYLVIAILIFALICLVIFVNKE